MRPKTAYLPPQSQKKILYNLQFGYYFIQDKHGKQIKVNKRGQPTSKFNSQCTGISNHHQRKYKANKDKSLMYTPPPIKYDKQNNPLHPKGSKLFGYAQYPYQLKTSTPNFLQSQTFRSSCFVRIQSKQQLKQQSCSQFGKQLFFHNNNQQTKKFKPFKHHKNSSLINLKFGLLDENCEQLKINRLSRLNSCPTCQDKRESVILKVSRKYKTSVNKRAKSTLSMSLKQLTKIKKSHPPNQKSYFEQSLSNIEKTEIPNYLQSDFSHTQFSNKQHNKTSIKQHCYKSSCHHMQYALKRRLMKQEKVGTIVGINQYQKQLCLLDKQKKLVDKLQRQLKTYQPTLIKEDILKSPGVNKTIAKKNAPKR